MLGRSHRGLGLSSRRVLHHPVSWLQSRMMSPTAMFSSLEDKLVLEILLHSWVILGSSRLELGLSFSRPVLLQNDPVLRWLTTQQTAMFYCSEGSTVLSQLTLGSSRPVLGL